MGIVGDYMTRHHRHCDDALARAEDSAAAADLAGLGRDGEQFLREMEHHLRLEEDILFPVFEERTGMAGGPTEAMRAEHQQMRGLFDEMRAAIEAKDAAGYLDLSETLLILLQQHNIKEEGMIYPMLDQALGEEAAGVLDQLEAATT
jgi:iron-sulfur cluster repair protein YtfE (RIC family)